LWLTPPHDVSQLNRVCREGLAANRPTSDCRWAPTISLNEELAWDGYVAQTYSLRISLGVLFVQR